MMHTFQMGWTEHKYTLQTAIDMEEEENSNTFLIASIYKHMKYKMPSALYD